MKSCRTGRVKTRRPFHKIGPSRGEGALTKKQAEVERDKFLLERNGGGPPARVETPMAMAPTPTVAPERSEIGAIIFGRLAELWRKDYVDNPMVKVAQPTRDKYNSRLDTHILPRWKDTRLAEFDNTKVVLDWLQRTCTAVISPASACTRSDGANITLRQEEGGSAIEASKIAGHATVSMTGDYTVVQLNRQEELTRAIQQRRRTAARKAKKSKLERHQAA